MTLQLLTPAKLGNVTLKNRVIFPSMCHNYCDSEGMLTERLEEYVKARARGGVGLIILPGNPYGAPSPARMALTAEKHLAGWHKLAELCHSYDCKLFVQLHPSTYSSERGNSNLMPDTMNDQDIAFFITSYAKGARLAQRAGLDGVEIHGAHAHEVAQFLSPYYNRRTDGYGGDYLGRSRFAAEMIAEIKSRTANELALSFRISGSEQLPGGRELEETLLIAPLLEKSGADALHVSVGTPLSERYISAPMDLPPGFNVEVAAKVKATVHIPVITVDRIISPDMAENIIQTGKADFVALGRGQLADPDFVTKLSTGEPIRPCLGCNQGCRAPGRNDIFCAQNPKTGRENMLFYNRLDSTKQNKKVLIAGAGIAGLEAGIVLAQRGFSPIIFESQTAPGGLINLAMKPPFKEDMYHMVSCRMAEVERLGIEIRFGTPLTAEIVKEEGADIVIVATGSAPISLELEDKPSGHVYLADEAIKEGIAEQTVAVLGGGLVGCEVAETLCSQGKNVTIFEMTDRIAPGLNEFRKEFLFERMSEGKVDVRLNTKIEKITLPLLFVRSGGYPYTVGGFDGVVLAPGRRSNRQLANELAEMLPDVRIHVIGDAEAPQLAIDAVYGAALCASEI